MRDNLDNCAFGLIPIFSHLRYYKLPHFHLADIARYAVQSKDRPLYYNRDRVCPRQRPVCTFALKYVYRFALQVNPSQHVTYMTSYANHMTP